MQRLTLKSLSVLLFLRQLSHTRRWLATSGTGELLIPNLRDHPSCHARLAASPDLGFVFDAAPQYLLTIDCPG
jgi:hypothetical protein